MVHESGEGRIDEVLDQQAWLMRLARKLGRDEASAEELAQDSLIAAWAHPPRERGGALRAWLRSVLVHRVRTGATAERRRREREVRSARPEAVAAADEIAERLELARRVAAALDELPEAERRALYLRYYEELSPADIARAVGAPLGTIKSRLALGREHLRRKLDREYGERGSWVVLLMPLGAAPLPVLTHPTATLTTAGASGPVLLGALTMATKTTVAIAAGAALVTSLVVWKPWAKESEVADAAPGRREVEHAGAGPELRAPIGESLDAGSDQRVELQTEAIANSNGKETTTGRVEIVATYASDGSPAANQYGFLAHEEEAWRGDDAPSARRFLLDSSGRAEVEDLESGTWIARLNGREVEGDALSIAAGASATAELVIQAGLMVRGTVLDDEEAPVSGAEVFLAREGDQPGIGTLALADAGGHFTLRDVAPWGQSGPYTELAARSAGRVTSRSVEAIGRVGDVLEIVLRLEGVGGLVRGRVLDSAGIPVAGAQIDFPFGPWLTNSGTSAEGLSLSAQPKLKFATDFDGRFASDRLPEGYVTLAVTTDEHPIWRKQLAIQPGKTLDVDVQLVDGGALEGIVLNPEGKPVDRARVWAGWPGGYDEFRRVQTDATGRYRIAGLHAGPAEVHAARNFGKEAQAEVAIVANETTRWDVRLSVSDRASGILLDEAGAPLEGWGVHVIKPDRNGLWYVSAKTDASGRFALDNCPEGPKELEVRLPEPFATPPLLIAPFPDDEEVTLVVPNRVRPSATLAGRFVDPSGADLEGLELWLNAGEFSWGKQILPDRASQAFTFGPVMPGSYRLSAKAKGYVDRTLEVSDLVPSEVRDLGTIELQRGSLLAITFTGEIGEARDKVLQLIGQDGSVCFTEHVEMSTWRSELLPPGTWTLRTGGDSMAFHESVLQLVAGETTELTIPVEPGTTRHFEVGPLDDGDEFSIEAFGADGRRFDGPTFVFTTQAAIHGLTPGRWRVVARSSSGRSGELELTIDSLEPTRELLKIPLR
jgi:RNA polymerase sigma factor (sigma-70 family)